MSPSASERTQPRFDLRPGRADSPTVVFLHGFLGRPSVWEPALTALAHQGPVAVMDLPGHGPDPWTPSDSSFIGAVDAMAEALAPSDPVWLVGYSMGARLALWLALRHPNRVAGAVFISGHPGLRMEADRRQRADEDNAIAERVLASGLKQFVQKWEAQPLFASQRALPESVRAEHRARRLEHTPEGIAWALRTLSTGRMPSAWEAIRESRVPLHFIAGGRDEKYRTLGQELATEAPNVKLHVVLGAGHDVVLENPAALAAVLKNALASTPSQHEEKQ